MPRHRFKLGQSVVAHSPGIPPGPYTITRLLPLVGKEPHYQAQSATGVVRALLESQIKAVQMKSRAGEPNAAVQLPEKRRTSAVGRR
jgi:hypothetical protein